MPRVLFFLSNSSYHEVTWNNYDTGDIKQDQQHRIDSFHLIQMTFVARYGWTQSGERNKGQEWICSSVWQNNTSQ
jgi:hypothetical protein